MNSKKIFAIVVIIMIIMLLILNKSGKSFAKYKITNIINVAQIKIDKTKPILDITYTKQEQNEKIIVTINANEEIEETKGWILDKDKKSLKKEYSQNTREEVEVQDTEGNITNAIIIIDTI